MCLFSPQRNILYYTAVLLFAEIFIKTYFERYKPMNLETLEQIGGIFRLEGKAYAFSVIKNGNINQTFKVTYKKANGKVKSYIFQKINTVVFKNPVAIMENIDRVTSHIRSKTNDNKPTLHFHHTLDGKNYYFDADQSFWRIMNYIDSITFDSCDDLAVIYSTGEAFGQFQMQLSDLDGSVLNETIPDFHNTRKRLDTLFEHEKEDACGRVSEVKSELDYIHSIYDKACVVVDDYNSRKFPVRVTHNDTKSNNVLFDKTSRRPLVVIDLDTVMPGMAMYDFGDAVRFMCNTAEEDEPDTSCVFFDTAKFRAFSKGFISQVINSLTEQEIQSLVPATFAITIELAARFLDDYITGDKYFKINYPEHNLVRARCQLQLAKNISLKQEELCWIVNDVCRQSLDNN